MLAQNRQTHLQVCACTCMYELISTFVRVACVYVLTCVCVCVCHILIIYNWWFVRYAYMCWHLRATGCEYTCRSSCILFWRGPAVVVVSVHIIVFNSVVCITNIMCHRLCICAFSLHTPKCCFVLGQCCAHVSVCCLPFDVYDSFDHFYGRALCIGTAL